MEHAGFDEPNLGAALAGGDAGTGDRHRPYGAGLDDCCSDRLGDDLSVALYLCLIGLIGGLGFR